MNSYDLLPDWIFEACPKRTDYKKQSNNPVAELDTEQNVKRAIDYLIGPAPSAIAFQGGNDTTYTVAARVRHLGLSEGMAFEVMSEHWNEAGKAEPPWNPEELQRIISNAYLYATGAWGGMSGLSEFGDATTEFPEDFLEQPKKGLFWEPFEAGAAKGAEPLGLPLVDDLLMQSSMIVLYGASGSGKTFVALDLAFAIATGRPWHDHETTTGLVVYVAAEGGRGIYKRLKALQQKHNVTDCPLALVPCPINLLDAKADLKELLRIIKEAEEHYGQPCRLVVIDTLSRAISGGEENASTDMGAFVKNVDKIREKAKCATLIVHHTGKDQAKGARGHSLLRAATDTEIEVGEHRIKVTKQRDIDPIKDKRFKLEILSIGRDEQKGKDITSCVVRILAQNDFFIELTPNQESILAALKTLARVQAKAKGDEESWTEEPVSRQTLLNFVVSNVEISRATFDREMKGLEDSPQIRKIQKGKEVQYVIGTLLKVENDTQTS